MATLKVTKAAKKTTKKAVKPKTKKLKLSLACKHDEKADITFYLQEKDGNIILRGTPKGSSWSYYILKINPKGEIQRYRGVAYTSFKTEPENHHVVSVGESCNV